MEKIKKLAEMIKEHNRVGNQIAELIGRPPLIQHVGEFIAENIFNIKLETNARNKDFDGRFKCNPYKDKKVDVKYYPKNTGLIDLRENQTTDFLLVLTGPREEPKSSKNTDRPWIIEYVYLFDFNGLVDHLHSRKVKIGISTSVTREKWDASEVYPNENVNFSLNATQKDSLALFADENLLTPRLNRTQTPLL